MLFRSNEESKQNELTTNYEKYFEALSNTNHPNVYVNNIKGVSTYYIRNFWETLPSTGYLIKICKYFDIEKRFYSSGGITDKKKNEGLQEITKYFKGVIYINAIGGQKLYNKEDFASQGIELKFIQMGNIDVDMPYMSMLDLLFRYDKNHLKNELNNYTLI